MASCSRRARSNLLVRAEGEHGIRDLRADVEDVERAHERRDVGEAGDPGEAERLQVDLLAHLGEPEGDVGKQLGQGLPARSARRSYTLLAEQQAEVPLQPAVDGVAQGQIQDLGGGRSHGHASKNRPVVRRIRRRNGRLGPEEEDQEEGQVH